MYTKTNQHKKKSYHLGLHGTKYHYSNQTFLYLENNNSILDTIYPKIFYTQIRCYNGNIHRPQMDLLKYTLSTFYLSWR